MRDMGSTYEMPLFLHGGRLSLEPRLPPPEPTEPPEEPGAPGEISKTLESTVAGAIIGAENINEMIPGATWLAEKAGAGLGALGEALDIDLNLKPEIHDEWWNQLAAGIGQYLPGGIPAIRVMKGIQAGMGVTGRVLPEILGGLAGEYVVSSGREAEGLVKLIGMVPGEVGEEYFKPFEKTLEDWLTDPETGDYKDLESRIFASVPGLVLGGAIEGLIRVAVKAKNSGVATELIQTMKDRWSAGKSPIPAGMSIEDVGGQVRPSQVGMREARAELKERVRAGEDFTDNPTIDPDEITEIQRELTLEAEAGQPVDLLPGEGNVTLDDPLPVPPAERDLGPPAAVEGAVDAGSFPVRPRDPKAPRVIRSIKQLIEDAKTTKMYREWYEVHRPIMEDIFGEDMQFFNDIVSITSQQASVDENIQRALKAYQAIKRGEGVENLGLLKGVVNNLKRLIGEADPALTKQSPRLRAGKPASADVVGGETYFAGKKIPDFVEAMRGSDEAVTMDRHMAQLLFNTSEPTMRQVLEGQRVVTAVANKLGWTPKETQAALWAFNQVRKGTDINDVRDYQKVLTERETEIRELVAEFGVRRPGRQGGSVPAGGATGSRAVRDQRRADRFAAVRRNFGLVDGGPDGDVSRGFTRDPGGDLAEELEGLTSIATYRPKAEVRRQFQLENLPTPHIVELDAASSASGFRQIIERIKASDPWGPAISVLDEADYAGARLFVTADGQAGFALRGDDIVSVFNIDGSPYRGVSTSMLQLAISLGGRRLDAFDTILPRLYSQAGFSVVARLDFDAKVLRAEGIDVDAFKKTFKEFNNGKPDVVFMVLAPDEVKIYRPSDGGRVKTFEEGVKAQQQALQAGGS